MSEQQPELRWAPIPPKPSNRGRIWLIVGLSVLALVIVGVLLFFLIPRGGTPDPGASSSPSPTASPTASPSASVTPTPSESPEATQPPVTSPPPPADPDLETFRAKMSPVLDDASTGLGFVADAGSTEEATQIVEQLQSDAQRLSEAVTPGSIEAQWRDAVGAYATSLQELRSAGPGSSSELDDARRRVDELRGLLGS